MSKFFDKKPLKILSYGCSTGEEARLIKDFFPESDVFGIDIDKAAVNHAKNKYTDIVFIQSSEIREHNFTDAFDIIFACSVFCRFPACQNNGKTQGLEFKLREDSLNCLFKMLKLGGVFCIIQISPSDFILLMLSLFQ